MSDWSTVAIAVGPAAVTGAVGYAGARLQLRGTIRQAEVELERLREQHVEDHLRHRQSAYHQLLDTIREVHALPDDAPIDDWAADWGPRYTHRLNAVALFGTAPVRAAAETFNRLMLDIAGDGQRDLGTPAWHAEWRRRIDEVTAHFRDLVDAMRADVAPD